jgi:hypothetical protein
MHQRQGKQPSSRQSLPTSQSPEPGDNCRHHHCGLMRVSDLQPPGGCPHTCSFSTEAVCPLTLDVQAATASSTHPAATQHRVASSTAGAQHGGSPAAEAHDTECTNCSKGHAPIVSGAWGGPAGRLWLPTSDPAVSRWTCVSNPRGSEQGAHFCGAAQGAPPGPALNPATCRWSRRWPASPASPSSFPAAARRSGLRRGAAGTIGFASTSQGFTLKHPTASGKADACGADSAATAWV